DHVGVISRTADDCALLFRILDTRHGSNAEHTSREASLRGIRLGVLSQFGESATPGIDSAFLAATAVLSAHGVELEEVSVPELELALSAGLLLNLAEVAALHGWILRPAPETLHSRTRVMLELGELVPAIDYLRARAARRRFAVCVRQVFESSRLDVL